MSCANVNGKTIFSALKPLNLIDYGGSLKTYTERGVLPKINLDYGLKKFIEKNEY